MKILLATFLLISLTGAFAQVPNLPIDGATHLITYTDVVKVDGNKDELYSRAREWFAKTYNSSAKVIQMDDKESGKIIGKALLQVHSLYGYFNYTISIYLKERRYKYEINNFYHTGEYVGGETLSDWGPCEKMMQSQKKFLNKALTQMDENIKVLIVSLKESMAKKAAITKDDF